MTHFAAFRWQVLVMRLRARIKMYTWKKLTVCLIVIQLTRETWGRLGSWVQAYPKLKLRTWYFVINCARGCVAKKSFVLINFVVIILSIVSVRGFDRNYLVVIEKDGRTDWPNELQTDGRTDCSQLQS